MIISMDLNASPLPEEDEQPYGEQVGDESIEGERFETSVETFRREREERRRRLRREPQDEGPRRLPQAPINDYTLQSKISRSYGRSRQLPQGWLDCPSAGQCIGHIIPSKVPLDETYNDSVLPGKRYSSKQVIDKQRRAGRELGLVIDLTNTSRYYSPSEWTRQGIKHVKIACKGRDAVPDNESVNIFVYEVMQFVSRQRRSKKYILVHCTHGHNRTGFMIIHFLMRTQLLHVTDALNIFAQARPPGIYKQDYIEALYAFYHESSDSIVCPSTPEWKRSSDLDLNGEAVQDDDEDGDDVAVLQERMDNRVITNDDVLGDAIPYDQQDAMRQYCYQLLDLTPTVCNLPSLVIGACINRSA